MTILNITQNLEISGLSNESNDFLHFEDQQNSQNCTELLKGGSWDRGSRTYFKKFQDIFIIMNFLKNH